MSTFSAITNSDKVSSFLPLTSAWPSSPGCDSLFIQNFGVERLYIYDPKYPYVAPSAPKCLPSEASLWWYQTNTQFTTTLLGGYTFDCPKAYSTVYSATTSSVTTIACCPSGYNINIPSQPLYIAGSPGECTSICTSSKITYLSGDSASVYTLVTGVPNGPIPITAVHLNGYIYPNPTSTIPTLTSTAIGSTPTFSITSTSVFATSNASTNKTTSKLSSRAKAGIGVGVSFGVIIVLSIIATVLLFQRKRRAQAKAEVGPESSRDKDQHVHELHDSTNYSYVPEMNEGNNVAELNGEMGEGGNITTLGGGNTIPEPDGSASKAR